LLGKFHGEASPLGAKDLGELTALLVAAAIANAVTTRSARECVMPIMIEKTALKPRMEAKSIKT